jgi:flavodoxin
MPINRRKFLSLVGLAGASAVGLTVSNALHAQTFAPTVDAPQAAHSDAPALPGNGSALVVYFSHLRATYPDTELEVGHTQRMAELINERVQSDIFRVQPAEEYPQDYDQLDRMAEHEERDRVFRELQPGAPDTDPYSTIFMGYPIWWGAQPMPLQTFMRDHNLNGKTIVPFCTHEGSQFGNSLNVLAEYYPTATVREGLARRGRDVYQDLDGTAAAVTSWLQDQGF